MRLHTQSEQINLHAAGLPPYTAAVELYISRFFFLFFFNPPADG